MAQQKFTVGELTSAVRAQGDLPRMRRNLDYLQREQNELKEKLNSIGEKIKTKKEEIREAEKLIKKFDGINEVLEEFLKSAHVAESPRPRKKKRKRMSAAMKKDELLKFFRSLRGQKEVKLAEIRRHFEENVTETEIGNVSLYFKNVIPAELYVESTSTRNRAVYVKEKF